MGQRVREEVRQEVHLVKVVSQEARILEKDFRATVMGAGVGDINGRIVCKTPTAFRP